MQLEKNRKPDCRNPHAQMLLVMKLTALILLTAILHAGAAGYAQKITLNLKEVSIEKAMKEIRLQTGYLFLSKKEYLRNVPKVSISVKDADLPEVLNQCLSNTGLSFRIIDKTIILSPQAISVATELNPPVASGPVTGKVLDENGKPMVGVTVQNKRTLKATATNAEGVYVLEAEKNDVLIFSFVGYSTQQIAANKIRNGLISMTTSNAELSDVVVTAFGIKRQAKELGYSTAKVTSKEITQAKQTNLATSLEGKVSGLQINTLDNSVDPSTRIVLRGNRSFLGNNQALLIVDGVQVELNYINYLNPNEVDNVTILKGANAAALYGSDASNGVLIVTTKKGVRGKPVVTYSGTYTLEKVAYLPALQNSYGPHAGEYTQGYALFTDYEGNRSYIPFEQQAQGPAFNGDSVLVGFPQRNGEVLRGIYKAYPNAKYDFFNTGHTFQNDISYSSADDKGSYFLSFQDVNTKGTVPLDQARRTGVRFNGSRTYGNFSTNFGLAYNQFNVNQDGDFSDTYTSLLGFPPNVNVPAYKNTATDFNASINGFPIPYSLNPYWYVNNVRWKYRNDNLTGNIDLNYKIVPWLNVLYRIGFSSFLNNSEITTADKTYSNDAILYANASFSGNNYVAYPPGPNGVNDYFDSRSRLTTTSLITATNSFGKFTSKIILGYTTNSSYERVNSQSSASLAFPGFFNIGSGTQSPFLYNNIYQIRTTGAFADGTFGYNDYLFVHGSVRRDESSLLAAQYRTYYYPGVDASFVATQAIKALQNQKVLTYAKLRASITKVGNINIPPYSLQNTFQLAGTGYNGFPFTGTGITSYAINQTIYNPLLQPEFTVSKEVGADLGFYNGRINFQFAYFDEKTSNQTVPIQVTPVSGYNTQYINVGEMQNKGYELDLNFTPLVQLHNGLKWNIGINYSYINNRVVSLLPGTTELNIGGAAGSKGAVSNDYAIVGKAFPYLEVQDWVRDPQGHVVVDGITGLPSQDPNPKDYGQLNPKYRLGLNSSISYKGLTLAATAEFRAGNVIFNNLPYIDEFGLSPRSVADGNQRFVYPNSVIETSPGKYVKNTNVTINDYFQFWGQNGYAYLPPAMFVSSADFWKIREVSLTYEIPAFLTQKTKIIKKATASLVGRNLFTWRPKDNTWTDPEFSEDNSNANGQVSPSQAPPVRSYGLNLTLIF